ncbi:unnamed protein product [Heterobilharzia americana]|nr:unnamed protein product [Heterobilharzia americana]
MVTKSANCLSEYGKAFAYLDSARNEYYDRLKFRIQRRNSEYAHQPFLWGDLDDLHHRDSEVLQLDHGKSSNEELKNNNDISLDVSPHNSSTGSVADEELVSCLGDVQQAVSGTLNHSKKDVGTQTQRTGLQKTIEQSKAFVPYAFGGSPAPISGIKRTFNVKSDRDVYPSAMRAEVRRKEKLLGCKQMSTLNTKRSGLFGPNSHVFKVQAHEPCKAVKRSSPVSRKSTVGVIGALQPSGLVASYANLNNHTDRETENAWTSEYIQKYPSYPSSVYVRSASVAAGRCRPFSFSYNRPSSSSLRSLVPLTPVLLSCRGSNPTPKSHRGTCCDICSFNDPKDEFAGPLLSAH